MAAKLCTWCKAKATCFGVFNNSKTYKQIVSRCVEHYKGENNPHLKTFYRYKDAKEWVDVLNVKRKL